MESISIIIKRIIYEGIVGLKYFNLSIAYAKIRCIVQNESIKSVQYKNKKILKYLKSEYFRLIDKYTNISDIEYDENLLNKTAPIWVLWWQGESKMPPIIKACHKSKIMHANGHPVILLDKNNYKNYIDFPPYIIQQFEEGKLRIQHLADMIRIKLIRKYGGLWLDASIFCTKDVDHNFFSLPVYSLKNKDNNPNFIANDKWTTFAIGGLKNNILCSFLDDFFMEYCKDGKPFIDYFMFDLAIALANENIPAANNELDIIPYEIGDYRWVNEHLCDYCNNDLLSQLNIKAAPLCKIAWNTDTSKFDKKSLFSYIINEVNYE